MSAGIRWLGVHGEFTVRPYDVDAYPHFRSDGPEGARSDLRRVAIVDTETLGLAPTAPVIEIAIRQVAYDPATGDLFGRTDEYASLHDPGVPIPAEITKLTGIRDEDVRGRKIDANRVAELLHSSALIVAHNAAFDRPRVDALITGGTTVPWACSSSMIDWRGYGLPSASLGALCLAHGFYVADAHRAMGDVAALLRLLLHVNAESGRRYFADLLAEARRPAMEVFAFGSPFEAKDSLKSRGYFWRGDRRVWSRVLPAEAVDAEREWLAANARCRNPGVVRVDPRSRFAAGSAA